MCSRKLLHLVDAGLAINSPYPLLLPPAWEVQLILSFDFSAGDPFEVTEKDLGEWVGLGGGGAPWEGTQNPARKWAMGRCWLVAQKAKPLTLSLEVCTVCQHLTRL
jgi:hypothetical protein